MGITQGITKRPRRSLRPPNLRLRSSAQGTPISILKNSVKNVYLNVFFSASGKLESCKTPVPLALTLVSASTSRSCFSSSFILERSVNSPSVMGFSPVFAMTSHFLPRPRTVQSRSCSTELALNEASLSLSISMSGTSLPATCTTALKRRPDGSVVTMPCLRWSAKARASCSLSKVAMRKLFATIWYASTFE